jgi:ATP-binding protein involved in chromosome partitioning
MGGNRILMKAIPKGIKASEGLISIEWSDAHLGQYQARDLRLACRCAACVDEWTHQTLVKPELVPQNVKPKGIEVMGNYAIHIDWSDGHNTGIYTYDFLREVCACDECRAKRSFAV